MIETVFAAPGYRVTPLARLARGGRWRTEAMRSYGQPVLYWFTRGQGRFTIHGTTRGYGPHNAIFLPAGAMHGFEASALVQGSAVFLPGADSLNLPDEPVHLRLRDGTSQAELAQQIDHLERELARGEDRSDQALACHGGLLAVWLARQAGPDWPDRAEESSSAARRLAAAYAALLERDFRQGRRVADYAAQLGITPTHLSRACKAASGRPASALLHDRLHYEARRLLRETQLPVKDVAASLGFRSAAYFTRAFQHRTGVTPSAFRRGA